MTETKFVVHLQDEIPKIGSGRRIVTARIGRKWVYVKDKYHSAKVKRSLWESLGPTEHETTEG